MKRLLIVLALLVAVIARAEEPRASELKISVEPLGDTEQGVASRLTFRFAAPPDAAAQAVVQGSILQAGEVVRNFRYELLSGGRDTVTAVQTLPAGKVGIEARLLVPMDDGTPAVVSKSIIEITVAKTGHAYVADARDGAEGVLAEGVVPEVAGAVRILPPHRDVAPNLFIVDVQVKPPVQRVEFFVEGKKVIARNAPPYRAELDLGKLPKRVEVRAIGYDAQNHYVDADAFIVNERETQLETKITRTVTPDGISHFKLSVQNPKQTTIKKIELYADDRKIHEWSQPPYALDLPAARLQGVSFVRASVLDDTGYEASDLMFLNGDRYIEELEVNVVELPIAVTDRSGAAVVDLAQSELTLLENGKPQTIASFAFASNLPVSVGLMLDHSGSMKQRMTEAKAAAVEFFRSILGGKDRAFVGGFAMDSTKVAPFASDAASLAERVNDLPGAEGGTSLYDAILTGLYRFRNVQGRKALIVITDGEDTTSRLSYEDMLTYARAARVPLYFIGISMGLTERGGIAKMKTLAAETGGVAYFVGDVKELRAAYAVLEKDLRSQYLVSYRTEAGKNDQSYRTIDVKVSRPNVKVRTIRGFIP